MTLREVIDVDKSTSFILADTNPLAAPSALISPSFARLLVSACVRFVPKPNP